MVQELFEIYERNFPFIQRQKETVLQILSNEENIVIEHRDMQSRLIGVAVINQNTILLLCVDVGHRNQGIGTGLLKRSEDTIKNNGYSQVVVGAGFDYITPGVPTSKRYVPAENEKLAPGVDGTASDFFTKRGYRHSWDCNCFDMQCHLKEFQKNAYNVGDTVDGITYRLATLKDLDEICACTDNACQEFTDYYRYKGLYTDDSNAKVLIAVAGQRSADCDGVSAASAYDEVVGTLIVKTEDDSNYLGSVGCTTVKRAYQGKHIAVNLVTIGTKYLRDKGVKEAYLSYTYTGLDHMYGYAGYKISVYYMMAVKAL